MSTTSTMIATATALLAESLAECWRAASRAEISASSSAVCVRMPSTSCLPSVVVATELSRRGIGGDLSRDPRNVARHVGAGGVGERGRTVHERALGQSGALERQRGPRQPRLRRARRRQELRLAGDHISAQAGLRVDHVALDVDRRLEVRVGPERRVGARAKVDDVPEQQRDAERHRRGADRDRGEHTRDQPDSSPHRSIARITGSTAPARSRRSAGRKSRPRRARG